MTNQFFVDIIAKFAANLVGSNALIKFILLSFNYESSISMIGYYIHSVIYHGNKKGMSTKHELCIFFRNDGMHSEVPRGILL